MTTRKQIDVAALIEKQPFGWLQLCIVLNVCAVMLIEGYDMQVTSYAAPAIMKEWHLTTAYFGPVFGFGLFGYLLGGTVLSYLGDRLGRRTVILGGAFAFGAFTLLTAYSSSLTPLLILRFLAGLGLGASIPSGIALAVEYSPERIKATMISILFLAYTMGATAGGFIAAKLIPRFGWPAVFQVGGLVPIFLVGVLAFTLPESLRFLVITGLRLDRARDILKRFPHAPAIDDQTDLVVNEERHLGFPVKHLLTEGRASITLLLWVSFAASLLGHYFLTSWLPTILASASVPFGYAVVAGALLQGGGGVGGLLLCWISDKKGMLPIAFAFCLAAPLIILVPRARGSSLLFLSFLIGFFLVGAQVGLNAISGTIYPTDIRSTGVGWALGIGRIGSILGPVLGGLLISLRLPMQQLFIYTALVVLCCAVTTSFLWKIVSNGRSSLPILRVADPKHSAGGS